MYGYSTGTSLNRVAKLSLPVQALGCARRDRTSAAQDTAVDSLDERVKTLIDMFSLCVMLPLYRL